MTITITYPSTGNTRTYRELTQREANDLVSHISNLNEREYVPVVIRVEE